MGKKCSSWTAISVFLLGGSLTDDWNQKIEGGCTQHPNNWHHIHLLLKTLRQPELHLVMVKSTWFLFFWCLKTQSLKRISTKEHFSSNTKRHLITVSQMKGDLIVSPEGRSSNELPTGLVTIHQHLLLSATQLWWLCLDVTAFLSQTARADCEILSTEILYLIDHLLVSSWVVLLECDDCLNVTMTEFVIERVAGHGKMKYYLPLSLRACCCCSLDVSSFYSTWTELHLLLKSKKKKTKKTNRIFKAPWLLQYMMYQKYQHREIYYQRNIITGQQNTSGPFIQSKLLTKQKN